MQTAIAAYEAAGNSATVPITPTQLTGTGGFLESFPSSSHYTITIGDGTAANGTQINGVYVTGKSGSPILYQGGDSPAACVQSNMN